MAYAMCPPKKSYQIHKNLCWDETKSYTSLNVQ